MMARVQGPLSEQTFLVLLAVTDEERHGYGIIGEVERLSGGSVHLGPGTLYGALDRLSEQGLVKPTRSEVVNGRLRRYYAITAEGDGAVRAETARRRALVRAATARLGRRTGPATA